MDGPARQDAVDIPPAALLLRDLVNTVEWQEDSESWSTPGELGEWLSGRLGIAVSGLDESDLLVAKSLREGLRSVFLQHAGHDPLPPERDRFNDVLARLPMHLRIEDDGGVTLVSALGTALDEPLTRIVAAVETARGDGSFERLKACARESCRWAYWDGSRNRSGRWCSMEWCGNYVKMRRRNGHPLSDEVLLPRRGARQQGASRQGEREQGERQQERHNTEQHGTGGQGTERHGTEERRAATLVDVAALAGVSIKTVSNVVTGAVNVAPATRSRVETAIAELGYRPNLAARALRSTASRRSAASAER
jgi:predicted RNA-binding Zn ribbon-like protein